MLDKEIDFKNIDINSLSKEELAALLLAKIDKLEKQNEAARVKENETRAFMERQKKHIDETSKFMKEQRKENEILKGRVIELEELLALRRAEQYTPTSEKMSRLADETEILNDEYNKLYPANEEEDLREIEIKSHTRTLRAKRVVSSTSASTPTYSIYHYDEHTPNEITLGGITYTRDGEAVINQAAIIPAKLIVEKHHHPRYVSKKVDAKPIYPTLDSKLSKIGLSASFVANTIIQKYDDHLPLYRQEEIYKRQGFNFSRQRMAASVVNYYEQLMPLVSLFKDEIYKSNFLNKDETPVKVLDLKTVEDKVSTSAFMYVTIGSSFNKETRDTRKVILMEFIDNRQKDTLLEDYRKYNYKGSIMTDGLKSYLEFENHSVCWVHAVRAFKKLLKITKSEVASHICQLAARLYTIESVCRTKLESGTYSVEQFLETRKEQSTKVIDEIFSYADSVQNLYTPKGAIGKAIKYLYTYKERLYTYLDVVEASPSNNAAELSIRNFVVGKKNWLFSKSIDGADASALFFSLIETAKLQKISPVDYVEYVLTFSHGLKTKDEFKALLPWNIDLNRLTEVRNLRMNATRDLNRTEAYKFAGGN